MALLERIADGRTDLVFDHVGGGHPATTKVNDAALINWCCWGRPHV